MIGDNMSSGIWVTLKVKSCPEIKESGFEGAHISITWIRPQARIKIAEQPIIQRKERSFRCRTKLSRVKAIAT